MPAAHIRVIATPNGGGFGGKSDPFNHEIVVAKAALMLDRPVKICLTREEVFYCHRGRHPVLMRFKTGVKNDGTITGMHLQTLLDGGAYGSYGVASTFYTGALQTVTYHIPTYHFQGCRVFTNKPPCGPKRGHGTPQSRFGQEIQLDKIAEELALDPAELPPSHRREARHAHRELPARRHHRPRRVHPPRRRVVGLERTSSGKLPHGRGVGLACSSYLSGAGLPIYWNDMPHSGVQLKLDRSGGVTAFCGATEIGQGSDDVLVGCVAEVLGIEPFDIRAGHRRHRSDAGRSRLLLEPRHADDGQRRDSGGRARARSARRGGRRRSSRVPTDRLVFADRRVFDAEDPDDGVTLRRSGAARRNDVRHDRHRRLVHAAEIRRARSKAAASGRRRPTPTRPRSSKWTSIRRPAGSTCPRVWIAHDIGRALNPTLVRGQVEGSVYMALGEALMEEQEFRRLPPRLSHALVHKFPSMLEYKSPTTLDMPEVITELVEHPDPRGPFGAKEVGQGPLLPVMPAVANAVYDAVGVRIDEVPITPEKIVKALAGEGRRQAGALRPDALSRRAVARARSQVPPPWEGGDGRRRIRRTATSQRDREHGSRRRQRRACRHDAAAPLQVPRAAQRAAKRRSCSRRRRASAMLVAGGTDLLPNMKRRQQVPATLIGLRQIDRAARRSPTATD